MHDEILRAIGSAVPLLLLAWYANRIRHPERSWLSAFLIFLGGVAVFPGAGLGLGLLWFRTGGDAIQAFVMGDLSPWVGFWLLAQIPTASTPAAEAAAAKSKRDARAEARVTGHCRTQGRCQRPQSRYGRGGRDIAR